MLCRGRAGADNRTAIDENTTDATECVAEFGCGRKPR